MVDDRIIEVGIDHVGRLFVRPEGCEFPHIYRAAMEVAWDTENRRLVSPEPRERTYLDWFRQIVEAAKEEYGVRLVLGPETCWSSVPQDVRGRIEQL